MPTVLIVDDEKGIRLTLAELLEFEGHEVFIAEDGNKALEQLTKHAIDVVITDIFLFNEDGIQLVKKIGETYQDIPIIVMTGDPSLDTAIQAIQAGVYNYLFKPVSHKAITAAVEGAANVKALRDDNRRLLEENIRHREHLEEIVKERTAALKESEQKYRLLAQNAQDMIWRTDLEGIVEYVNPSVEDLLGYAAEEATGLKLQDYITEEGKEKITGWVWEALHAKPQKLSFKGEVEYRHRDGHVVPCELNVSMIRDDNGRIVAFEGVTRDISLRREMEKRLRNSEEMFRSITEQSQIGILIVQDAQIIYANNRCAEILGYTRETLKEWLPGGITRIVHADDLTCLLQQSIKKQEGEDRVKRSYSFRCIHSDGHTVYLRLFSNRIKYKKQSAVLVNVLEIDEEEWLRLKLDKSEYCEEAKEMD